MKCTICNHPQHRDINVCLLSGGHTLKALSRKFGPSPSALHRHKNHLEEKMRRAQKRLEDSRKLVSLLKLSSLVDNLQRQVEAAAAEGDTDKVFKGCQIGSRLINQMDKMDVPLDLRTVYCLVSSPGYGSQDSIMPAGPQVIAALHQALVDSAFSPCPDPLAESAAEDQDEDGSGVEEDYDFLDNALAAVGGLENDVLPAAPENGAPLETRNPELETAVPATGLCPDPWSLATDHSPDPDLPAAELLPAEKAPKPKREKSAKLTRQKRKLLKKKLQNQKAAQNKKNPAPNSGVGRQSEAPPETHHPELATAVPETGLFTDLWPLAPDH